MIRAALRRSLRRLGASLTAGLAQKKDIDDLYDQVAGLMQVQSAMRGAPVLKPLRLWVLSPDAMAWILADLQERVNPTIVEFGSGQSTVIFAACLKHKGQGRLISVEHDPAHADAVRRQLIACGLSDVVDLRVVPLADYPGVGPLPPSRSYATATLPAVPIDVALVDGPPLALGEATRFHPMQWTLSQLAPGGAAFLDDAARPQEQAVLTQLQRAWVDLVVDDLRAEKGLARCTRAAAAGARDGTPR
jgi:predicted O-methyltransferase YrrM